MPTHLFGVTSGSVAGDSECDDRRPRVPKAGIGVDDSAICFSIDASSSSVNCAIPCRSWMAGASPRVCSRRLANSAREAAEEQRENVKVGCARLSFLFGSCLVRWAYAFLLCAYTAVSFCFCVRLHPLLFPLLLFFFFLLRRFGALRVFF